MNCQKYISKKQLQKIYEKNFAYILIDIHPQRQSEFVTIRSNIFDKNFTIIHTMEYVAIPKNEFIKHFKILHCAISEVDMLGASINDI